MRLFVGPASHDQESGVEEPVIIPIFQHHIESRGRLACTFGGYDRAELMIGRAFEDRTESRLWDHGISIWRPLDQRPIGEVHPVLRSIRRQPVVFGHELGAFTGSRLMQPIHRIGEKPFQPRLRPAR